MAMLEKQEGNWGEFRPQIRGVFSSRVFGAHQPKRVTNRDLLMTNWFVLEVIIRMRVAGVWEFFTNDQWMWNLGVCVGSSWELTWTIWGAKTNEDDFVV